MARARTLTISTLITLGLAACAADDRNDDPFGPGGGNDGGEETGGDDGDDGAPGDDGGDETGDDGDTGEGGDDGDDQPPAQCDFTLGCYAPSDPDTDVGYASHVPAGCDGGEFQRTHLLDVSTYADPEAPRSIPHLGDFNGDGTPDIVLNFRKASVGFVFAGDGTGNFTGQPAQLPGGLFAGGWGGDLGDFNGDGNLDILLGDHTRSGRAFSGSGGMSFSEARAGLPDNVWFSGAGLADLNGDGNLDAIFGKDQFASGFELYHGGGDGSWTVATAPPASGASNIGYFAFADYDDDGKLDIFAFGRAGSPGIDALVFHNDGTGFSLAAQLGGGVQGSSADPIQGSIGDIDCDGDVDVAVGGTIYAGENGSWSRVAQVDGSRISHLADMNGDGMLDVVTHDPTVGLALYLGDGSGSAWTPDLASGLPDKAYYPVGGAFNTAYGIDIADLDQNGNLDIVRIGGFGSSFVVEAWSR